MMKPRTPYYSYDAALLDRTLACAQEASRVIPGAHIHYAVKANSNPDMVGRIAAAGFGADCVSDGEIRLALQCGIPAGEIVFAGVGKTDAQMEYALDAGIFCFNVESVQELEILAGIASSKGTKAGIALRLNPDIRAHTDSNISTGTSESKFGIDRQDVPKAIELIRSNASLEFRGLHFHIGSQILDMRDFVEQCQFMNRMNELFTAGGMKPSIINVGGGLGVDYEHPARHPIPDFKAYFDTYAENLHLLEGQEFHCELGRSLVAQCGSLVCTCLFVKEGRSRRFLIIDAGMNDLVRPALYGARHRIENLSNPDGESTLYDVVGPICETTDCFGHDVQLPFARRGDTIAILSAGAYGESMASTYNSRPLPQAVMENL